MTERQTDQVLYPKILWNRPISRATAGRLLLVGGHKHHVAELQACFQFAQAAGIGQITMLVPESLRSTLGGITGIEYASATASGSIAKAGLGTLDDLSQQADTILVGPDLSNNSETSLVVERLLGNYSRSIVLVDDALEVIVNTPDALRHRNQTLVVLSMQQLFKLAGKLSLPLRINPEAGLAAKIDIVSDFWDVLKVDLALVGPEIIIRCGQQTSVTPLNQPASSIPAVAGLLAVFYTQNPDNHFEGLTTAAFVLREAISAFPDTSINRLAKNISVAISNMEDS